MAKQAAGRKAEASSPGIVAFCITQVFNDHGFDSATEQPASRERAGKFVLSLDAGVTPDDVASIIASGPDGYEYAIRPHVAFGWPGENGCIDDKYLNEIWYMGIDKRGLLDDGLYTITVRLKDGRTVSRSRELTTNSALLDAYLAHRKDIAMAPDGLWVAGDAPSIPLRWTTLKQLAGIDAYYCARLSRGWPFISTDNLDYFDNIFALDRDRSAGLNQDGADVVIPVQPGDRFTWFLEIVDSNRLDEINLAIFQPYKRFQVA